MPGGRPTDFTQELADVICLRLAEGESLRKICRDDAMPDKSTVLRWLGNKGHSEFRDQYARARELQADALTDEILEIADDSSKDTTIKEIGSGEDAVAVEVVDHEHIQRSRLRVDARKWIAAKLAPKKYGDRLPADKPKERDIPPLAERLKEYQRRDDIAAAGDKVVEMKPR